MLVWVVLLCLCAALPNGRTGADECMLWSDSLTSVGYRARHGMVACTPRATWSRYLFGHLARFGLPPPLVSRLVAPFGRLTWCPHTRLSRACARPRWARPSAHRRRSEPSDRPDRFDPPFVPAMGNTSGAHFLRRKALATFLGGEFEAVAPRLVVPPAHLVGHAFQGCCPPQLPHTCWRPFGHGVAHARRLKSAHTWSAKRGRTWGGVICCCW